MLLKCHSGIFFDSRGKIRRHFNDPSLLVTFVLSGGRKKTEMSGETVMRALEIVYKKTIGGKKNPLF